MEDEDISARISRLAEEERRLHAEHVGTGLSEADARRLVSIETQLDQCWDLLRQRRALREMGEDPDQAGVRDERTVEGYLQ
ncbi:MAG TPA: DUF2630 family protein [Pseudonocardiaceae bacterium]|jgi:hypothetical protein